LRFAHQSTSQKNSHFIASLDSIKSPLVQLNYIQLDEFEAVRDAFSANAALVNEPVNQHWNLVAGQVIFLEPVPRCPNQKCPQWAEDALPHGLFLTTCVAR